MSIYDYEVKKADGEVMKLADLKGKVVLIVNTASKCGFTPQYEGLEKIYEKYSPQLEILAFPSNQFGSQEPGSNEEIQSFCRTKFSVKFPVLAKVDVNGEKEIPLYTYLKSSLPGILGIEAIKWNFTKFLVDKKGVPVERFAPQTKPEDLAKEIEKELKK